MRLDAKSGVWFGIGELGLHVDFHGVLVVGVGAVDCGRTFAPVGVPVVIHTVIIICELNHWVLNLIDHLLGVVVGHLAWVVSRHRLKHR